VRRIVCIGLIMATMLVGCTKGDTPAVSDEKKSPDVTSVQNDNKALHDQVSELQAQLQSTEQKLKDLQKANESSQAAQQPLISKYPNLANFSAEQEFQKIEIKDAKGSKTITDPDFLKSTSTLFLIVEEASFGSGPQADIEPVQFILTTAKGTFKVNLVQMGVVSFDDLYPGQYFKTNDEAYQLAKAFMNKPSYIDNESTIVEMVNSGLIKVDDKNVYYVTLAGRIRSIALAFHNAKKIESKKPNQLPQAIMKMTFYHYGKEIQMNLYEGQVQIKDSALEKWFELKAEDIEQIRVKFSAS
jgi:TolA-binding protein